MKKTLGSSSLSLTPLNLAVHSALQNRRFINTGSAILLSAGIAGSAIAMPLPVVPASDIYVQQLQSQKFEKSLVIIDSQLKDNAILSSSAPIGSKVYRLDVNKDGIEQISEILKKHDDLTSVHFLSHGGSGYLSLGNAILKAETINYYKEQIQGWQQSLSAGADLLFYGCETASGAKGEELLDKLAELTGADVAGSDDLTGAQAKGGDWDLEYKVGGITASIMPVSGYQHVLAGDGEFIVGDGSGGGGGGGGETSDGEGGDGGAGGAGDSTITGTAYADVIFGDGSGGGGGSSSYVAEGQGGLGGGGNDVIYGGAGDDIIFGDGFDGQGGDYSREYATGGAGGLGGGGGGGGSDYSGDYFSGGAGGIGAGGGGGGDYGLGGAGGLGGGGGGSGGSIDSNYSFPYAALGGGLGATDGGYQTGDSSGGGGGGGYFGVGALGGVYSSRRAGTGGDGGGSSAATGNGATSCGDYDGGGGGGGFGNGNGGASGCDNTGDEIGENGVDGDENEYRMPNTGGVVTTWLLPQLPTVLTDNPNFGGGDDTVDGGAGSDVLFGLDGNDIFEIDLYDANAGGGDTDIIADFVDADDELKLSLDNTGLNQANLATVLASQVAQPGPNDRTLTYNIADKSGTVVIMGIGRDVVAADAVLNIAPTITGQNGGISFLGGTQYTVTDANLNVNDPDNTYPNAFSSITVNAGANYSVQGGDTIVPTTGFKGWLTVPAQVTDGQDTGPVFNLNAFIENVVPVVNGLSGGLQELEIMSKGSPLEITLDDLSVTDPDDAYPADFTVLVRAGANYTVTGTTIKPDNDFVGILQVPVAVFDGDNGTSADTVIEVIVNESLVNRYIESQAYNGGSGDSAATGAIGLWASLFGLGLALFRRRRDKI